MTDVTPKPPVVILSGGSEVVSAALVDEFRAAGHAISLVSMGRSSVLAGAIPAARRFTLDWPTECPQKAVEQLLAALAHIRSVDGPALQVFPTEDSGLRLLLEHRERIEHLALFGHSRNLLRMGGLDKSELFGYLAKAGCADVIAPTLTLHSPADAEHAWSAYDGDCVIKPALKPWSMRMQAMPGKALMSSEFSHPEALRRKLDVCWSYSSLWVAQPRLRTPEHGEKVVYLVRDEHGGTLCMVAAEPRKQPRYGGTSCVVISEPFEEELVSKSQKITDALDIVGLCELAFLKDSNDQWRMLEMNPRPWLQIGLARAAGLPLARQASLASAGYTVDRRLEGRPGVCWVNAERLLISALSGDYGSRLRECIHAMNVLRQADSIAIYSSESPGVRWRWWRRMLLQLLTAGGC
jgi:hypothetical protein